MVTQDSEKVSYFISYYTDIELYAPLGDGIYKTLATYHYHSKSLLYAEGLFQAFFIPDLLTLTIEMLYYSLLSSKSQ